MAGIVITLANGELAGRTMQEITKKVNEAATALKKAEIGSEDFLKAQSKFNELKGIQEGLKSQITQTTKASEELHQSWGGILQYIPGFSQISGAMQQAKGGVGGLTTSFRSLGTAIALTGIGLLIIGLTTLVNWFRKTDEGATFLGGVMRAFGAIVDRLFKSVREIGGGLMDMFENPKQAAIDFVDFLKSQLINRITAVGVMFTGLKKILSGDFKEGLLDVANGQLQMLAGVENLTEKMASFGKEIAAVVKEGMDLEAEFDRIADRARELQVIQAESEKQVDKLILQAKNVALSYDERLRLLEKASAIELANHREQLKNSEDLVKAIEREIAEAQKGAGVTDELDQKYKDAQVVKINLDRESIQILETIENRRSQLLEKRNAELAKQAEEEAKVIRNIEDLKVAAMQESMAKEIAQIQLDTQQKIEALKGSAAQVTEQKALLEEEEHMRIQAIRDKHAQEQLELDRKLAEEQKQIARQKAEFEMQMQNLQMDTANEATQFFADVLATQIGNEKEAKKIRKGMALIDIGINLQKELSANALAAAANPLNAVTFGAAGAAQLAATNTASILRSIISAAKVIAFRKGGVPKLSEGVLRGRSHEWGGIPLVAEDSEIVMTAGVYKNPALRALASAVNVAGGGRSFAMGGVPINPFNRAASSSTSTSGSGNEALRSLTANLEGKLDILIELVGNWPTRLKVENVAMETRDVINTINKIEADASV